MRLVGRSGGGAWRGPAELVLRATVLGILAWLLVHVVRGRTPATVEVVAQRELRDDLVRWSTSVAPNAIHATFDAPPPRYMRDWLAALPGAATAVTWNGSALIPTAAAVEPVADPMRGADFLMAAPEGVQVVLRDALGAFDSVASERRGVRLHLPSPSGLIEAAAGAVVTRAPLQDSLVLGRLLLLAHAGWEGKFAAAALEERGWKVDAVLAVSPKGQGDVRQGKIVTIDTAVYAAVLAVDTVAARYAGEIVRYVRSGGGLVLWADAAKIPGLASLVVGPVADTMRVTQGEAPTDSAPRRALAVMATTSLRADAVELERHRHGIALAARRVGPGRVLQNGYVESWRWRMAGAGEDAPAAHREWLARLVANVAYTGRRPIPGQPGDIAPLATLIDELGPPLPAAPRTNDREDFERLAFVFLIAALLLEWASRRIRGAS